MKRVMIYFVFVLTFVIFLGYSKPVSALYIVEPSNVSVSYISDTSIKLNYKTNNTNSNYKVQIFNSTLGKLYSTEVNTTSYTVTGLDFGKTYNFLMRVYYKTVTTTYKSNWTSAVSATPKAASPVINSITSGDKSLTLNYKVTGSPKGVQIYNSNTKKVIDTTNLSTYKVTGLTNGTTYKFLIRNYYDNNVYGPWSAVKEGQPNVSSVPSKPSTPVTITYSQAIANKAKELAWPYGTSKKTFKYSTGKPTDAYKAALNKVYPNRKSWGARPRAGSSCDVFVGTVVRATGYDKSFPRGLSGQKPHLKKSSKWSKINRKNARAGDIFIRSGHIMIYGGKIDSKYIYYEAHYKKWNGAYGMTASKGAPSKQTKYTVYRAKGNVTIK